MSFRFDNWKWSYGKKQGDEALQKGIPKPILLQHRFNFIFFFLLESIWFEGFGSMRIFATFPVQKHPIKDRDLGAKHLTKSFAYCSWFACCTLVLPTNWKRQTLYYKTGGCQLPTIWWNQPPLGLLPKDNPNSPKNVSDPTFGILQTW